MPSVPREIDKQRRRALAERKYDDPVLKVVDALTKEEKIICQHIAVNGPNYLRDRMGWAMDVVSLFLERSEIMAEITALQEQYKDRAATQERTQFFTQMQINSLLPAAVNILIRALRGNTIKDGVVTERAPDRNQLEAAMQVLDRANIQGQKYAGNNSTPSIDARQVHLTIGGKADQLGLEAEDRKQVVGMVSKLLSKMSAAASAKARIEARLAAKTTDAEVVDEVEDEAPDEDDVAPEDE